MRMKDLKAQLDAIEARQNEFSRRFDGIDALLRTHEHNHHGVRSKILQGIPWTALWTVLYVIVQLV